MASCISRPTRFSEVIGQNDVVNRLKICIEGCKITDSVVPHILIDGPPGLGKTTISSAIATELGVNIYTANAASLRTVKSLYPYLLGIAPRSIFFIDEIHRLPKLVEEFLYPIMEDFKMSITVENKAEVVDIPLFTLVGATTSGGSLSQPFYDRFLIKEHLSFYSDSDLAKLAGLNAKKLGLTIEENDLLEIAKRSKGTPRILNARLQWYRNYTLSQQNKASVNDIFNEQGIDSDGLDIYDKLYLKVLQKNKGNPLGLKSISSMTGIAIDTIENSVEPFLVRKGFVIKTQRGRVIGDYNDK